MWTARHKARLSLYTPLALGSSTLPTHGGRLLIHSSSGRCPRAPGDLRPGSACSRAQAAFQTFKGFQASKRWMHAASATQSHYGGMEDQIATKSETPSLGSFGAFGKVASSAMYGLLPSVLVAISEASFGPSQKHLLGHLRSIFWGCSRVQSRQAKILSRELFRLGWPWHW